MASYSVQSGDTVWALATRALQEQGIASPTNAQILAMVTTARAPSGNLNLIRPGEVVHFPQLTNPTTNQNVPASQAPPASNSNVVPNTIPSFQRPVPNTVPSYQAPRTPAPNTAPSYQASSSAPVAPSPTVGSGPRVSFYGSGSPQEQQRLMALQLGLLGNTGPNSIVFPMGF